MGCSKLVVMFVLVGSAFASKGYAQTGPDPRQVYIQSVTYGGTGCPQGSVGNSIASDRSSLTLIFDRFVASVGPGVPITEARKNCQINLNLHIPQGWAFSIATFDYRGYVQLAAGQRATQKAIYYFQGETTQASAEANFAGPVARDYLVRDTIPLNTVVWSDCGVVRPVNINAQVRIDNTNPQASGQITTDSIDGKVRHILGLQWRRC
jgi:hypothetical protein